MPRDYEVYLEDIRDAIGKIKRYTASLSRADFENDDKTVDAVVAIWKSSAKLSR